MRRLDAAALVDFKELLKQAVRPDWHPEPVQPDEMAVLIYSGGTTGVAKGIMLSHFNFVANAHQIIAWGHLTDEQGVLAVLPLLSRLWHERYHERGSLRRRRDLLAAPFQRQDKSPRPSKSTDLPSLSAYRRCSSS